MTIAMTIVMIIAVFFGPIAAVQITRYLDNKREIRERKLRIFKALMTTRNYYATSWQHVEALNMIDLEFDKKKEKEIIDAWKEYLDLLNSKVTNLEQWDARRVDLLVALLHKMAQVLDYDFDKTHIKNSFYSPIAHGEVDYEQQQLRRLVLEVLEDKRSVPMHITKLPPQQQEGSTEKGA